MKSQPKRNTLISACIVFVCASLLACTWADLGVEANPPAPTSAPVAEQPAPAAATTVAQTLNTSAPANNVPMTLRQDDEQGIVERIFSQQGPAVVRIQLGQGLGSGFLIDNQGTIVTNNHVIEGQREVSVFFTGLYETRGVVLGTDPDSDIAVVRVDEVPEGVQPVVLGDSSLLNVGQMLIAIGNPLGQDRTVTTGIVSALGRTLQESQMQGNFSIGGVIQTDAAINPGNSGGPLFNAAGEVIGMNTAVAAIPNQQGASQLSNGIGYAVPSNLIKKVVPELIEKGAYDHPYLGVSIGEAYTTLDVKLNRAPAAGLRIRANASGPVAQAGLREDAILTAVDGQVMTSSDDLISYLELEKAPGDTVILSIVTSNGQTGDLTVTLGARPRISR
jgi:S1-C subfamily serine protease